MVKTVFQLDFTVFTRTFPMRLGEAFWISPPRNPAMKMMTPGVLIQLKLSLFAPSSG